MCFTNTDNWTHVGSKVEPRVPSDIYWFITIKLNKHLYRIVSSPQSLHEPTSFRQPAPPTSSRACTNARPPLHGCPPTSEAVSQLKILRKRSPNRVLYWEIGIQFRKISNYETSSSVGGGKAGAIFDYNRLCFSPHRLTIHS